MSDLGYLLYGFYKVSNGVLKKPILGVDGKHSLEIISLGNLAAIVSQVSLQEFGEESLRESLQDVKWLEKNVRAYDEITRKLFQKTAFIPVRFGTVYLTKERISESIADYKNQILTLLNSLEGKIEIGIKFYFNREKLFDEVISTDKEVKELEKKLEKESPGKAHFLRKKFDVLVDKKIKLWSDSTSDKVFSCLQEFSSYIQPLNLRLQEGPDVMFLNVACLLVKENIEEFKNKVQELLSSDDLKSTKCEFTGPWPPYSFAKLDTKKEKKATVDATRK